MQCGASKLEKEKNCRHNNWYSLLFNKMASASFYLPLQQWKTKDLNPIISGAYSPCVAQDAVVAQCLKIAIPLKN
jgi:hypothetical protein